LLPGGAQRMSCRVLQLAGRERRNRYRHQCPSSFYQRLTRHYFVPWSGHGAAIALRHSWWDT
jgi:hypothetical protein